jgi:hypothetical protein
MGSIWHSRQLFKLRGTKDIPRREDLTIAAHIKNTPRRTLHPSGLLLDSRANFLRSEPCWTRTSDPLLKRSKLLVDMAKLHAKMQTSLNANRISGFISQRQEHHTMDLKSKHKSLIGCAGDLWKGLKTSHRQIN